MGKRRRRSQVGGVKPSGIPKAASLPRADTSDVIKRPLEGHAFLFCMALCIFLLTSSYAFYQVNAYKLFTALLLALVLAAAALWPISRRLTALAPPLVVPLMFLLPVLGMMPGLLTEGPWPLDFREATARALIVVVWAWLAWVLGRAGHGPMILRCVIFATGVAAAQVVLESLGQDARFRSTGSFGNQGYVSGWMLCVLPVTIVLAHGARFPGESPEAKWHDRGLRVLYGLTAVLLVLALLVGKTRVAQLLTAAVLGAWVVIVTYQRLPGTRGYRWALCAGVGLTAAGALLLIAWQAGQLDRFAKLLSGAHTEGRLVPWRASLNMFMASPWFGYGPGSYYTRFFSDVDSDSRAYWIERSHFDGHSLVLDVLAEGGLSGCVAFFAFWAWVLWRWCAPARWALLSPGVRLGMVGILAGIAVMMTFALTAVSYRMLAVLLPVHVWVAAVTGALHQPGLAVRRAEAGGSLFIWIGVLLLAVGLASEPLRSKYDFMVASRAPVNDRYAALKQLIERHDNIYALERMLAMSMGRRDWPMFFSVAERIQSLVPYFRATRLTLAQGHLMRGEFAQARAVALDFQRRDMCLLDNNKLLSRLIFSNPRDPMIRHHVGTALLCALKTRRAVPRNTSGLEFTHQGDQVSLSVREVDGREIVFVNMPAAMFDGIWLRLVSMYRHPTAESRAVAESGLWPLLGALKPALPPDVKGDKVIQRFLNHLFF